MSDSQEKIPQDGVLIGLAPSKEQVKLITSTVIKREWSVIPNKILCFPIVLGLSDTMTVARERMIALTGDERKEATEGFRVDLLADILEKAPYMTDLDGKNVSTLPDYPVNASGSIEEAERNAKTYFSKVDAKGRRVFSRVVEDIIDSYWTWATPRPISSASVSLPTK